MKFAFSNKNIYLGILALGFSLWTYIILMFNDYFLHSTQSKVYCLTSGAYGQFGNNMMSLTWALYEASLYKMTLTFSDTDVGLVYTLKNALDLSKIGSNRIIWTSGDFYCAKQISWKDSFRKFYENRDKIDFSKIVPFLSQRIRDRASHALLEHAKFKNDIFTVHGRSLEQNCFFAAAYRHEHAGVFCPNFKHNLCLDYSLLAIRRLFRLHGQPVLFTDGQNAYSISTYKNETMIDKHDFLIQLWMMVLSPRHVGNTGSSLDYLVWLWKSQVNPESRMYPPDCFPLFPKEKFVEHKRFIQSKSLNRLNYLVDV